MSVFWLISMTSIGNTACTFPYTATINLHSKYRTTLKSREKKKKKKISKIFEHLFLLVFMPFLTFSAQLNPTNRESISFSFLSSFLTVFLSFFCSFLPFFGVGGGGGESHISQFRNISSLCNIIVLNAFPAKQLAGNFLSPNSLEDR